MTSSPGTDRVNVRLDTRLSTLLSDEATWRRCTRSDLTAALITAWLGHQCGPAPADPPPARPTVTRSTTHVNFSLPAGLWDEFKTACETQGRTAPGTLTRLLRWLLGDETEPPPPALAARH